MRPENYCGCVSGFTQEDLIFPEPNCISCGTETKSKGKGKNGSTDMALECDIDDPYACTLPGPDILKPDGNYVPSFHGDGSLQVIPTNVAVQDMNIGTDTVKNWYQNHCPVEPPSDYNFSPEYKNWFPTIGDKNESGQSVCAAQGKCAVAVKNSASSESSNSATTYQCIDPKQGSFKYGVCKPPTNDPSSKKGTCVCEITNICKGPFANNPYRKAR